MAADIAAAAEPRRPTTARPRSWRSLRRSPPSGPRSARTRAPCSALPSLALVLLLALTRRMSSRRIRRSSSSATPCARRRSGRPAAPGASSLGTDGDGHDMLSRLIFGARVSLFIGVSVMSVSFVIGVVLGLSAAMAGPVVDVADHAADGPHHGGAEPGARRSWSSRCWGRASSTRSSRSPSSICRATCAWCAPPRSANSPRTT